MIDDVHHTGDKIARSKEEPQAFLKPKTTRIALLHFVNGDHPSQRQSWHIAACAPIIKEDVSTDCTEWPEWRHPVQTAVCWPWKQGSPPWRPHPIHHAPAWGPQQSPRALSTKILNCLPHYLHSLPLNTSSGGQLQRVWVKIDVFWLTDNQRMINHEESNPAVQSTRPNFHFFLNICSHRQEYLDVLFLH